MKEKHMNPARLRHTYSAAIGLALLLLTSSVRPDGPDEYAAYAPHEEQTYQAKSCLHDARGEERCAQSRLTVTRFPDAKWLDALLAQKAVCCVFGALETYRAAGFQAVVDTLAQLDEAYKEGDEYISGDESYGELKFGGRYGGFLQFSYHVWTYSAGAAHGQGGIENFLLNVDTHAPVALEEILVTPEKRAALDERQRAAYRDWLVEHKVTSSDRKEQDAFLAEWFSPNGNWKIVKDGLAFNYSSYEAGPYAIGMPEVRVPKAALEGIVKPGILKLIP
ncbi:MAG: RsiV family protein [Zoogloeaceae bacterium]|nr:RsiV family protein [Zoogloeaceae bacterium]